ncbi:MAG: DUF2156 domain-containing protein [Firmicutes bacterium]|nr:DUF2156 domain-containing protein [Bacillota bacterium]
MDFRPVTLEDKDIFRRFLAGRRRELITYSFSSFFLWRDWDPYTWAIVGDALVVKSSFRGLDSICVPIAADDDAVLAATEQMIATETGGGFCIGEATEADIALYEKAWPSRFQAEAYPDGANYIYRREDLALLKGNKYHGKRNQLRHFERACPDCELRPINEELIPGCRRLMEIWRERQGANDPEIEMEYQGCLDGLDALSRLDCEGLALTVKGQVAAFSIGEMLNDDTYAIHIEKGDTDFPGVYQAINCLSSRTLPETVRYINRAEDMGDAGLRRAKESYHPCRMEMEYYLRLKK